MSAVDAAQPPVTGVVRGRPAPSELAALLAVLLAATPDGAAAPARAAPPAAWADRARGRRIPPRPGPDGWRASARPR